MRNLIVARSKGGVIGNNGKLPWRGNMPADMTHFRDTTMGYAVIMGRHTFEDIGRPLKGRRNIVISRTILYLAGCDVVKGLKQAYEITEDEAETFVIGGSLVYDLALPAIERLYLTEIEADLPGNAHFDVDLESSKWKETSREAHPADDDNRSAYIFLTYEREGDE